MKTTIHRAGTRGHANHGWLNSYHSFSFAGYYNPERMHFGALRVLNDDTVAAGMGFGKHPHDNMEIISIPTFGDLKHKDSMGNETIIKEGDIQIMSAGTGIAHSEMNANTNKEVRFFQIWIFPDKKNVEPRYDQYTINVNKMHNNLLQVLSPNPEEEGVWIHQDAWFSMGNLDKGFETSYTLKKAGNGVYAFVIEGDVTINGQSLNRRDGMGIEDAETLDIKADTQARLLLMDVPMR
ncbi:MAG: pirin family protein [Chitinophagaceae bacterium]|nr:pirin family protein [Chitinophagaceae bacterium]